MEQQSTCCPKLIPVTISITGFTEDKQIAKGILPVNLNVGSRSCVAAFFMVDDKAKFGIPQTITVNNVTVFEGSSVRTFVGNFGMSIIKSTPLYAQNNRQAESFNKAIKKGIQRIIEDNPSDWHNILSEVLWAYGTSKRPSTRVTTFTLVYGHDVVLPVEINIKSFRVKAQDYFDKEQCVQSMCMELEAIDETRILALNQMLI
ncbi:uncharacterized protein LOC114313026 [Camellia sinensis]|uniref:uncharacterized protein LOC114313026 n=1 Tax=Camellia sinensis TaxID=4442 RepID=UPI0010360B20|nr:uncharacterized protein LOC114313026 [Camellia sinensis]